MPAVQLEGHRASDVSAKKLHLVEDVNSDVQLPELPDLPEAAPASEACGENSAARPSRECGVRIAEYIT